MTAGVVLVSRGCKGLRGEPTPAAEEERRERSGGVEQQNEQQRQLSLIALLLAAIRKSMVACRVERQDEVITAVQKQMDIGWPTDVRHITHVTFDRFNGFLGLPVEFEVEIPSRVPSASASVFGVSPESMQCSYDSRGNSVPTILLLMQQKLYAQSGLKAEGIFRINPENGQEECVRDQLNKGVVPDDIDVHCLAGLIKAWFRELPEGVLDCLSPEQVLQCHEEEEYVQLTKQLLPTQSALLNWAVELMADVVEEEEANKMNARNIAMVFAPNMTQMSDPLTALMHAVQVMNLLKTLIQRTLREREEDAGMAEDDGWSFSSSPEYNQNQRADEDADVSDGASSQGEEPDSERQIVPYVGESTAVVKVEMRENPAYDGRRSSSREEGADDDSLKEIEDCFLRQLEWKEEDKRLVCYGLFPDYDGNDDTSDEDDVIHGRKQHMGHSELDPSSSIPSLALTKILHRSSSSSPSLGEPPHVSADASRGSSSISFRLPKQFETRMDVVEMIKC